MKLLALRWILLVLISGLLAVSAEAAQGHQDGPAGRLDLRDWNFASAIARLDGHWQFAPGRLLEPGAPWPVDAVALEMPGSWNDVMGGNHGQGTYRLSVNCNTAEPLALALPIQHSAMALYVNGRLLARQGRPGAPGAGHEPAMLRQHVPLPAQACPLDLLVQVSNFEWLRGGLVRSIQLGSQTQLAQRREEALALSVLALGATLMVALFSLSFQFAYSASRRDRTPLYFGLFCMSCAISLGLSAERPLQPYLDWLGFQGQVRLLFANWSVGLAMFPFFLGALYPREAGRLPLRLIAGFSCAATLAALVAPVALFAMLAPGLQVAGGVVAVYAVAVLVRALLNRRFAAAVLLLGLAALVGAIVHDVVHFQHVLAVSMLPYGMLAFVVAPAALLALRLARALSAEELRVLEQRGRSDMLVRATKAGVLDWDATSGAATLSDRYREMLGYPVGPDAPDPPPFRELLHPEDHDKVHGSFMRQLRERSGSGVRANEPMDYRMRRADGEYIWVHAEAISLCGADGRTLRYICSFIDISERKRHEQELAGRIKFINDLFDSVPLGLALRDPQGRYLIVNRAWERYNGLQRESVIGASLQGVDDPAARSALVLDQQALECGPGIPLPPHEHDYNGRRFMQTRTAMADADGHAIGVLAASLDITEKHQAEQALATERERLRLLVRSTRAGFGDWDAVRDVVSYSGRFKEMLGWPPDADTAQWPSIFEMMHPQDRDAAREQFRQMIRRKARAGEQEPGKPMSYRLRRRDGSYIWIHAEGISQVDEQGRTRRFITSYLDVTAFREQEEALRRSAAEIADRMKFINDLVDSMPLALSMRDLQGRYVFANRTWERYYGLRRDEVVGRLVHEVLSPHEATNVETLDAAALERGPDNPLHTPNAPFRGREFTQMRTVMTNARNEALGVVIATQDVTEQRAVEKALATEQHRIELVVRAARAGIVDWNGLTRTAYYSPRLREILGYPSGTDTSKWPDYFEMIHSEDSRRVAAAFKKHVTAKRAAGEMAYHDRIEYRLRRADGSWVWVQGMGVSQSDDKGYTVRFIASITDISERRAQDEAIAAQAALLERQNEALKENVRLREEVERISRHDIKTPLNSIVAVPRLLREERQLGPEADELLGIVERAGYRILSMVNLSLDLHKMEQGSYVFRPDALDLHDLVGKVLADVRMHAASKQVKLEVEMGPVPFAWAEELLCYSLLANLLKNAVEASPEGAAVTVKAEAGEAGTVVMRIHNRGVVPESIRGQFFQKYATLGKASGTGLGTYSARLMAKVQDGDIALRTSEKDGTTLTVVLRAAPAGAVPATARHAAERRGVEPLLISAMPATRVLLVDDDEYNLLIVRRFLPTPPFSVSTAINGRVALGAAELQWPDVIFMDLDMPVMGGLEAVQQLRAMERDKLVKRCTMVALSSHEDEETRRRALAAGFDRYLTKPVTRDIIHGALLELNVLTLEGAAAAKEMPGAARRDDPINCDPEVEVVMAQFLKSRRQLIARMSSAMEADDRAEVRRIAHQLAGSFALYGFAWASELSRWIEKNFGDIEPARLQQLAGELRDHLATADIRFAPYVPAPSVSSEPAAP
jgi:PAS domain S-box-containing protein